MRDYAKVVPRFWTGPTGIQIRSAGRDAQVLALYLFTCPAASMTGLYYIALPTLCHEAGFTLEEARTTLRVLADLRFAYYDETAGLVWVVEAARYQIGELLVPDDKRVKGVVRELESFRGHAFVRAFYARYRKPYSLPLMKLARPLRRPLQAPSKGLRSHEHEQEQEQEHEQDERHPPNPPAGAGGSLAAQAQEAEAKATRARIAAQVELARQFAIHEGYSPWREHLRTFKHWFAAGLSLADVQHRIELGEHLPPPRGP